MKKLLLILLLLVSGCSVKFDSKYTDLYNQNKDEDLYFKGEIVYLPNEYHPYGLMVLENQLLTSIYFQLDEGLSVSKQDIVEIQAKTTGMASDPRDRLSPEFPTIQISSVKVVGKSENEFDAQGYLLKPIELNASNESDGIIFTVDKVVAIDDVFTQQRLICPLYTIENNSGKNAAFITEAIILNQIKLKQEHVSYKELEGYDEAFDSKPHETIKSHACFSEYPANQTIEFRFLGPYPFKYQLEYRP